MSAAIPLLPLCAFLTWTRNTIISLLLLCFIIDHGKSPRIIPGTHDKFVLAAVVVGIYGLRKYMCMCVCVCVCVCVYVCIACVYVCMYICMYICMCICTYVCKVCVHSYMYVCMHAYKLV